VEGLAGAEDPAGTLAQPGDGAERPSRAEDQTGPAGGAGARPGGAEPGQEARRRDGPARLREMPAHPGKEILAQPGGGGEDEPA
jgi:hypothetical protein